MAGNYSFFPSYERNKKHLCVLTLTAVFIILSDFLFNENSNFCILPEEWITIKDTLDKNGDGRVSDAELEHAISILRRAKNVDISN